MSSTKVSDMSVSGEIENLEYEIKKHENKLEDLKKRLDKLLMIRPMSDEERQRAKEKYEANHSFDEYGNYGENNPPVGHSFGQPLRKKQVWRTCVSCGGPSYNDFCGFCQEEL